MTYHFNFGANWRTFLDGLDEGRLQIAIDSLLEFLESRDLKGRTFVDVGCGSGLFSYAAFHAGAERIVSFDLDPECVRCCEELRRRAGLPDHWTVMKGSALDREFLSGLGKFDVVYSWGVLHHTGRMWEAIENCADLAAPRGVYYLALYNKILTRTGTVSPIHKFWTRAKLFYNAHPWIAAVIIEPAAMTAYLAMVAARLENPLRHVREYRSHRGMSWFTDARDWLGGYPYEYATVEEVFKFMRRTRSNFVLTNLKVTSGRGLNWYLFENR
jgi:2-polyprenyl-6-hydroxyphenyl methylase/3-demethylubiquinone-9 3-methyltransferase